MRLNVDTGVRLAAGAVLALAPFSATLAQDAAASPEQQAQQAVELRQSVFHLIAYSFGPIGGMLKNKVPFDAAVVQKSAARIEALAPMISETFQLDTRKFPLKTRARDGIWGLKADFDRDANNLVKAAADLSAAAKTGDKAATLQAAGSVGKACGACHDTFREK